MLRRREFLWGLVALFTSLLNSRLARGEHYLDFDEAAHVLFPEADGFAPATAELDGTARKRIKSESGMRVRKSRVESLTARQGADTIGWVYLDEVIGKHEYITWALALNEDGSVKGLEILEYRETCGYQVREEKWRAQFRGKRHGAPLKLDQDIHNITGATLSCSHVTDGVRRLLATYELALRK